MKITGLLTPKEVWNLTRTGVYCGWILYDKPESVSGRVYAFENLFAEDDGRLGGVTCGHPIWITSGGLAPLPHAWLPMKRAPRDGRAILALHYGCKQVARFDKEENGWSLPILQAFEVEGAMKSFPEGDFEGWRPIIEEVKE